MRKILLRVASAQIAMLNHFFKHTLGAFTIFACLTSLTNAQYNNINVCDNAVDGLFLADISNCSNYYLCLNKEPIAQECGNGLYFDAKTQSCGYSNAGCINCDPATLSLIPYAKTCNKYVMCYAGQPMLRECCDDLQFSATDNECNLPSQVDCVDNFCNIQNDINNIVYISSLATCNKYYVCMSGVPIAQTCAKGLNFNPECNCCDLAANTNCTIKTASISTKRSVRSSPQVADIGCPQTGTHFYPHSNSNQYYVCVNGIGSIFTCADGLFYDQKYDACRELKKILFN